MCSVYVQGEQGAGVPVYDSPGSDQILATLLDGVKLTAIGPQMQGGWVAVYLETVKDELYGYVEGKHLRFDDQAMYGDYALYDVVSGMQPVRIASGSTLYTIHNPRSKVAAFDESTWSPISCIAESSNWRKRRTLSCWSPYGSKEEQLKRMRLCFRLS